MIVSSTTRRLLLVATLAVTLGAAERGAQADSCTTTFDNSTSVARIYGQWKIWGQLTKIGASGESLQCPGSQRIEDESCIGYNEPCGSTWLEVRPARPSGYQVFGLHFDNAAYSDNKLCNISQSELGYLVGSTCTPIPNILTQGRKYGSDTGIDWTRIARRTSLGGGFAFFDLTYLNLQQGPIQLWYQKRDGSVYGWNSLSPAYYYLGGYAIDVSAVWIGPATSYNDYTLDSVTIIPR
jgi:hypothetical protein